MKRIVLALGGNALGQTPQEQIQLVKKTAKSIVDLVEEGYEIVVGHGNGPQIGMINLAMDFASAHGAKTPTGQHIVHKQEQPPYRYELDVPCDDAVSAKVFVIDDLTHSTMLLAEEY